MIKQKVYILSADTLEELAEMESGANEENYEAVSEAVAIRNIDDNQLGIKGFVKFMSKPADNLEGK